MRKGRGTETNEAPRCALVDNVDVGCAGGASVRDRASCEMRAYKVIGGALEGASSDATAIEPTASVNVHQNDASMHSLALSIAATLSRVGAPRVNKVTSHSIFTLRSFFDKNFRL